MAVGWRWWRGMLWRWVRFLYRVLTIIFYAVHCVLSALTSAPSLILHIYVCVCMCMLQMIMIYGYEREQLTTTQLINEMLHCVNIVIY